MQVLLIGKNNIYKVDLPSNISGEYWISDKLEKKDLIKIQANNGAWQVVSNHYAKIINPKFLKIEENVQIESVEGCVVESANIKEYGMYVVALGSIENVYILYCLPKSINDFFHLEIINTQEITIGTDPNSSIMYINIFVSELHARIFRKNKKWYIENYDSRYGTFLNSSQISNEIKQIENGDVIFIMGLKIILINNNLFVNNPQNNITLSKQIFQLSKVKNVVLDLNNLVLDENIDMIKAENYFSRAPRIINSIVVEKVKIDEPPAPRSEDQKPLALIIGPSAIFGLVSFVTFFTVIYGIKNGTMSIMNNLTSLMFPLVSLISMLIIPILNFKYDKKAKEKYELKRQQRYKDYLNKKKETINHIKEKQKEILYKNYPSSEECTNFILSENHRLWERRMEDDDFLTIRLGTGDVPLQINITYPEEKFVMEDDDLIDIFNSIFENTKKVEGSPIITSLIKNTITAFIFKDVNFIDTYMKNIIVQLVTFQSYEDLNLVFLVEDIKKWEYVKMLPHIWDISKKIRFFADDFSDMNEISKYLVQQLRNRLETKKNYSPHYLIITDNYKKIENLNFLSEFFKVKEEIGFSLLCITEDFYQLPNECKTFIKIDDGKAILFENENSKENQKEIVLDELKKISFYPITKKIANIPIRVEIKGSFSLPNNYSFLEMYNVGCIKNLNILERWRENDSSLSLKAQIGIDNKGNPIFLDIHEKYHGPHGLIAGSTGSGKSEFIMTYILSLAINYHPNDVNFLLIDYKGGGLAGAFEKNDIKLPHLVGTITNIDTNGLQRSLISVQSELRRRQVLFNKVRDKLDEGTIDIYKYQRLYHNGIIKEPIPHLLIICDEFAELKQQQPDFMNELMSVSRIGRSLGVHLILATQKPTGIVNDQIRSNSKFAVCLKVQDVHDSYDVIKKPDAAYLKNPGQFYLQVGNSEYFVLGQSGWAGASYIPSKEMNKKGDTSIEFISNIGYPINRVDDVLARNDSNSKGEQLTSIIKYVYQLAEKEKIVTNNLWLENIPENIYLKELREKYHFTNIKNEINVVLGEYDDPYNQKQDLVKINLMEKENILIYGNGESGKETFLSTFIYDLITNYTSEQVQFYLLDFGSEALKIYKKSSHVGDIVFINESEKIDRLFELIQNEVKNRKQILSDDAGDYDAYLSKGNKMPFIIIILNNYEAYEENYNMKYDEIISAITRDGIKYGILFVITASSPSAIRYRLKQNFSKQIALQLNKDADYNDIFGKIVRKKLPKIFGRGIFTLNYEDFYEFQTARICNHKNYNSHIQETIDMLNQYNPIKAIPIPVVPDVLLARDVKEYLVGISQVPIGMIKNNFNIYNYDFKNNFITMVTAKNMNNAIQFTYFILEEIKELENVNINILDAEYARKNPNITLQDLFKQFSLDIQNNIANNPKGHCLAVIIGINKFISDGNVSELDLTQLLKESNQSGICSFVIIDNPSLLKKYAYSDWYRNYITPDTGIWVGNGITEQTLWNINYKDVKVGANCDSTFGFVLKDGETSFIKLIGMKEDVS